MLTCSKWMCCRWHPIISQPLCPIPMYLRLLALIHSLEQTAQSYKLSVLCADPLAYKVLSQFPHPHVQYEQLEDVEDDSSRKAKADRTFHEYCWTLKPAFLLKILESSDADYLAHLDTDLYFYHDPEAIFAENPLAHVFLTDHMNSKRFYHFYELSGRFNTGFVGCRNTDVAKRAVTQWKENCIAHCTVEMDTEKRHMVISGMLKDGSMILRVSMWWHLKVPMRRFGILKTISSPL